MDNRILRAGTLALLALALSGCPKDFSSSDEFEEDVQPITGVNNQDPDVYKGRVMNGQLENALVWLDQGQNGAISSASSIEEGPLPADPWTVTDEEGRFELDVTGFQRDLTEGADWDPRDASLMVIAVPGVTINHSTGETVEKAFFLKAPPGLDPAIVTPFTTMAETVRRLNATDDQSRGARISASGTRINDRLRDTVEFVGVYKDYLSDSDARRMPFYAQALARTIQAQVLDEVSDVLGGLGDPIEPERDQGLFEPESLEVIGSILLDQAPAILAEVDADIDARGIDGYSLPPVDEIDSIEDFGPDLADPLLLRRKTTYLRPEQSDADFDASSAEAPENLAATETYDYDLATALRRADFRGQAAISMEPMVRLANLGGRIHEGGAQWGLELALDEQQAAEDDGSRDGAPSITDRFLFSWGGGTVARLQAPRLSGLATIEDYADDVADRIYEVASLADPARVGQLERKEPGDAPEWTLSVDYANGGFNQTTLNNGETLERDFGGITECTDVSSDNPRVVTARQEITIEEVLEDDSRAAVATERLYGHLREEPGEGIPAFRVLVREYIPASGGDESRRWDYRYFDDEDGAVIDSDQPDLLHSVRIVDGAGELDFDSDFCNTQEENEQSRAEFEDLDAFIRFEHRRFTDYLNEIGTGN